MRDVLNREIHKTGGRTKQPASCQMLASLGSYPGNVSGGPLDTLLAMRVYRRAGACSRRAVKRYRFTLVSAKTILPAVSGGLAPALHRILCLLESIATILLCQKNWPQHCWFGAAVAFWKRRESGYSFVYSLSISHCFGLFTIYSAISS